jgi:hypothetical protein
MKLNDISVELRLSPKQGSSNVKAFADVGIPLGDCGAVNILGCSVLEMANKPPRVMMPARKGQKTWFDIVELAGKIRSMVEAAVLAEYERQTSFEGEEEQET